MNKFQKAFNQITKDDVKKDIHSNANFRLKRICYRSSLKRYTYQQLLAFKDFNK